MLSSLVAANAAAQNGAIVCKGAANLVRLPDLPEASGVAVMRGTSGYVWSHNDSGAPEIFAIDGSGNRAGRVTISGVKVNDWEAMASGPCPSGSCLYIGDIGDNDAKRRTITIYKIAEPAKAGGSVNAEAFHASYPGGPHNAETLLVAPDGTLLVVTKGDTGPVAVFKFPKSVSANATVRLEPVGAIEELNGQRITDGAISPDGQLVVLRSKDALMFYSGPAFLRGEFKTLGRFDTATLREPQGEGVTFGPNGVVYLAGEGGGKKQPGTLGTLSCNH
jgi:hypothetical protein